MNAVYDATADERHVLQQLEVTAREWESLSAEEARVRIKDVQLSTVAVQAS